MKHTVVAFSRRRLVAAAVAVVVAVVGLVSAMGAGAATTNLVANPSLESAFGAKPAWWLQIGEGASARTFRHLNNGADSGGRFARTQVTSYTSGAVGWRFAPVRVSAGGTYTYLDAYRSNAPSRIRLTMIDGAGRTTLRYFSPAAASARWAKGGITFMLPPGITQLSVGRVLTSTGYLDVDSVVLYLRAAPRPATAPTTSTSTAAPRPTTTTTAAPAPTTSSTQPTASTTVDPTSETVAPTSTAPRGAGIVSVTFDDSWQSQYTNGRPVLNAYGIPGTFYLVSTWFGLQGSMSLGEAQQLRSDGHEIGSHTRSHRMLPTLSADEQRTEIEQSAAELRASLGAVRSFAYPNGQYDSSSLALAEATYQTSRTTAGGLNRRGSIDRGRLRAYEVTQATTAATLQSWLSQAAAEDAWVILVYHAVGPGDFWSVSAGTFDTQMGIVSRSGLRAMTVSDAYAAMS